MKKRPRNGRERSDVRDTSLILFFRAKGREQRAPRRRCSHDLVKKVL